MEPHPHRFHVYFNIKSLRNDHFVRFDDAILLVYEAI